LTTNLNPSPALDDSNACARYWFYSVGVNVIPQPTKSRDPGKFTPWKSWQDKPVPEETFEKWIAEGSFRNAEGMAIVVGKVWRGKHAGKYLIFIDCDNKKAIYEFCTLNEKTFELQDIAEKFIVEQHLDDRHRAHIYFYSEIPFIYKPSDANKMKGATTDTRKVVESLPAYEIKGLGSHGIAFVSNSVHKYGERYRIIGTMEPITLQKDTAEEMMYHLDAICRKHGLTYLENVGIDSSSSGGPSPTIAGGIDFSLLKTNKALIPMKDLLRDDYRVYAGHNRHLDLLRVMEHYMTVDPEHALEKSIEWNQKHCVPPKEPFDFERDWKSAKNFVSRQNMIKTETKSTADAKNNLLPGVPNRGNTSLDIVDDALNSAMNLQSNLKQLEYEGCERLNENEILVRYTGGKKVRVNFKNNRWESAFEKDMLRCLGSEKEDKSKKQTDNDIISAGLSFLQDVYRAMLIQERQKTAAGSLKKFDLDKTEKWGFSIKDVFRFGVDEDEIIDSAPPKEVSVAELIRARPGRYIVSGTISSVTNNYRMVRGEILECKNCLQEATFVYKKPDDDKPKSWKSTAEEMVEIAERKHDAMLKAIHEMTSVSTYIKCPNCKDTDPSAVLRFKEYDYVPTVEVELRNPEDINRNEMDSAKVKIFGVQETSDIKVGEQVRIIGKLYILKTKGKPNAVMYAENVEYTGREVIEITDKDKEWIQNFVKQHSSQDDDKIIDELVHMFAPEIIGHEMVKFGMLMVAAYTGSDTAALANNNTISTSNSVVHNLERMRIHAALVGPPGTVKTWFLKRVIKLVPNSLNVSAQGVASGKSLTAVISKEEGEKSYTLRYGPLALARGAICSINEVGRLTPEDQGHLLDAMEEGIFTKSAYGFHVEIRADCSLVVSANPKSEVNSKMMTQPSYRLTLDDVPFLRELMDRVDLLFVTRYDTDEEKLQRFLDEKDRMEEHGVQTYVELLRKYIQYAKTAIPEPTINKEAREVLKTAYIGLAQSRFGSPRVRNTLYRITRAVAKLKLKKEADVKDARKALGFFQAMIAEFTDLIVITERPKDLACRVMTEALKASNTPILFSTLVEKACATNPHLRDYFGNILVIDMNWKLRAVRDMLINDSRIMQVQDKPIALKWVGGDYNNDNDGSPHRSPPNAPDDPSNTNSHNPSDVSDVSDGSRPSFTPVEEFFQGL
jgi:DNA replicative helicase MCM subunit Mcm2 (Cdc46/Mcm family)